MWPKGHDRQDLPDRARPGRPASRQRQIPGPRGRVPQVRCRRRSGPRGAGASSRMRPLAAAIARGSLRMSGSSSAAMATGQRARRPAPTARGSAPGRPRRGRAALGTVRRSRGFEAHEQARQFAHGPARQAERVAQAERDEGGAQVHGRPGVPPPRRHCIVTAHAQSPPRRLVPQRRARSAVRPRFAALDEERLEALISAALPDQVPRLSFGAELARGGMGSVQARVRRGRCSGGWPPRPCRRTPTST